MRLPLYLSLSRHGVYYFRYPLPVLSGATSTVRLSLGTRDPRKALRLSEGLRHAAHELSRLMIENSLSLDDFRSLLREHFGKMLESQKQAVRDDGHLSDVAVASFKANVERQENREGNSLRHQAQLDGMDRYLVTELLSNAGISTKQPNDSLRAFTNEYRRADAAYARAVLEFDRQYDRYQFGEQSTEPEQFHLPTKNTNRRRGISLKRATELYRDECMLTGTWTQRTENEKQEYFQVLFELIGEDTDIGTITADDASRVKTDLQRYPRNRRKHPKTRELSIADALLVQDVERLSVPTLNKYMQTYKGLFGWAAANKHISENLFDGMPYRQGKRQKEQSKRAAFSPEQIRTIRDKVLTIEIPRPQYEYRKWGPLIAMYTGARLNEIAQLMLKDLQQKNGIWVFDLNDDGDRKSVKNSASKRRVPVHEKLIEYGLLDYVDELRARGATKLFPDFNYCPTNGWGRTLGRWVNNVLLVDLGIKETALTFHSFRHTVVTSLLRAEVAQTVVQTIVGHEREGVTQQTYFSAGYTVEQLAGALEKLNYD